MSKYVIIGNSAAAIGAIEGIRQKDREGKITVVSAEAYHTYSRPLISYLLLGRTTLEKMRYREDDFYCKNRVDILLSNRALSIDAAKKTVLTDKSGEISYDKLLVATGSVPFVPPMQGLEKVDDKFSFYTLDDALALQKAVNKETKVLIVGAGLIGLKCAEGIHKSAGKITIVDLAPRILSSILDQEGAEYVRKRLEEKGIEFVLGASVKKFSVNLATLNDGRELDFDVLVLAIGVRPNVGLVKDAGGAVNKGIVVSNRMETSIPDIYAAGDCTENPDVSSGLVRVLALLPSAYTQGETAGINMAGGDKIYSNAIPMNAMGLFGLHMITAGTYEGEVYSAVTKDNYKKLFYKDDRLKGYILIGNIEKAGIYTSIITERTPLSDLDFGLICERPSLIAFSKDVRKQKLGGVER
jgi:NAD(P)H-nitrite reductase